MICSIGIPPFIIFKAIEFFASVLPSALPSALQDINNLDRFIQKYCQEALKHTKVRLLAKQALDCPIKSDVSIFQFLHFDSSFLKWFNICVAKIMPASAMRVYFQIAECRQSSAKIRFSSESCKEMTGKLYDGGRNSLGKCDFIFVIRWLLLFKKKMDYGKKCVSKGNKLPF